MANSDTEFCSEHSGICVKWENVRQRIDDKFESVNVRFDFLEKANLLAKDNLDKEISLARTVVDGKMHTLNQVREQLSEQGNTFAKATEVKLMVTKLEDRIFSQEKAVQEKFTALGNISSERRGSSRWSEHIVTVILASGMMLLIHYLFKL